MDKSDIILGLVGLAFTAVYTYTAWVRFQQEQAPEETRYIF